MGQVVRVNQPGRVVRANLVDQVNRVPRSQAQAVLRCLLNRAPHRPNQVLPRALNLQVLFPHRVQGRCHRVALPSVLCHPPQAPVRLLRVPSQHRDQDRNRRVVHPDRPAARLGLHPPVRRQVQAP